MNFSQFEVGIFFSLKCECCKYKEKKQQQQQQQQQQSEWVFLL